ncbi:MAG: HEAT repeat domain-containing protein [Polyangiaceae bacterium]
MFPPSSRPRNLEASFRDLASQKSTIRCSSIRDVVRHALLSDGARSRAIPLLERALRGDEVAAVRAASAVALADVSAREALATLLVAVEDDDAYVREMALAALGEIGDSRAAQRLERATRDERPEIRYQAVIAYVRVVGGDAPAVTAALLRALEDADDSIRYIAMRLVEERSMAGDPIVDERVVARAKELVRAADDRVSIVAALYLARLGRPDAHAIVLDVVAERRQTPELEDEQACVELVGDLEIREAIPHLERRVYGTRRALRSMFSWGAGDSASCAWHGRIALARMGHERARSEILADLRSRRRRTREAAVVAAGRAQMNEAREAIETLGTVVDAALVREALIRLAAPADEELSLKGADE